jgi:hypothetical protein
MKFKQILIELETDNPDLTDLINNMLEDYREQKNNKIDIEDFMDIQNEGIKEIRGGIFDDE